jgi:acyl CoA:acetate/3-ketoacid CoA transferase alpha subunit
METGLVADVSLVKAWKADKEGNLSTARPRATSIR